MKFGRSNTNIINHVISEAANITTTDHVIPSLHDELITEEELSSLKKTFDEVLKTTNVGMYKDIKMKPLPEGNNGKMELVADGKLSGNGWWVLYGSEDADGLLQVRG
jgi:hypothetical protein